MTFPEGKKKLLVVDLIQKDFLTHTGNVHGRTDLRKGYYLALLYFNHSIINRLEFVLYQWPVGFFFDLAPFPPSLPTECILELFVAL